jgi:hypothetical protein
MAVKNTNFINGCEQQQFSKPSLMAENKKT